MQTQHITFRFAAVLAVLAGGAGLGCRSASTWPFPFREPLAVDTDMAPVNLPCRPDPSPKDPKRLRCAPEEYVPAPGWDHINNSVFDPISQALSVEAVGEAVNVNSMDEIPDSAWFTNRLGARPMSVEEVAAGGCKPEDSLDALEEQAAPGSWVIDRGKSDGASFGFRVDIPGKGKYMLKTDDAVQPEQANAGAVIGAAIYHAAGYNTTCEQVIYFRRELLKLTPGLIATNNQGISHPFDEAALDKGLSTTSTHDGLIRMTASKWLSGLTIGPYTFQGLRRDDPNDVIHHEHRRDLRGSRLIAAWLNHWDARDQNSMDVWIASDATHERSSPGYVRHYVLDTSDVIGQAPNPPELSRRLGHSYYVDPRDFLFDLVTLGIPERPWDRAHYTPGHERFAWFSDRDFDAEGWKPSYPNPAFTRMTERDGAWMARILARFSREQIAAIVGAARFSNPSDPPYLVDILMRRRQNILERYFGRLSPVTDVHGEADGRVCAVDLARATGVFAADRFRYEVVQESRGDRTALPVTTGPDGVLCFAPRPLGSGGGADGVLAHYTRIVIHNGAVPGPLEMQAYDLGARGMRIVGVRRPAP